MKVNKLIAFLYSLIGSICLPCWSDSFLIAQDLQYSQFYNAPLYLNPAFAGTAENSRAVLNYRSQWPGLSANTPYSSYSISVDHIIEPYRSGVGLMLTRDRLGGNLSITDFSALYAYQVDIGKKFSFRPGLQASVVSRNFDFGQLVYGDQISNNGISNTPTTDLLAINNNNFKIHPNFAVGGLFFSDLFWVGLSGHNLNMPNVSFNPNETSRLPIKISAQAGMQIPLGKGMVKQGYKMVNKEKSFMPVVHYKRQASFQQLDIGAYAIFEPMMFGLTYRGIPLLSNQGFPNNESIIMMMGLYFHGFTFGYSFDIVISQLSLRNSAGAHEVALIYEWNIPYPKSKKQRPLPCPKFHKFEGK
jgi:type IX secretion system PorP/SprF family membrane protein